MATSLLVVAAITAHAQFFTIQSDNDTSVLSRDPYAGELALHKDTAMAVQVSAKETRFSFAERSQPSNCDTKLPQKETTKMSVQENVSKIRENNFENDTRNGSKKAVLPAICMTDSLLLSIIKRRLNVCMPISSIYTTSGYGYRKDPFKHCIRFHDGIDLRCREEVVYNMLPGKVERTGYDANGYGNYIITVHGNLQFLYGHLSKIHVRQGETIEAGSIIATSGNSGKRTTGPHLHLRLRRYENGAWKSVDPHPFIMSLNEYINELNEKFRQIIGEKQPQRESKELTIANLYDALIRHGIKFPKIVLAQAILESGWKLDSLLARSHNNLFGLRNRKGFHAFDGWEESVKAYKRMIQYKYKEGQSYIHFLRKLGYATDPLYYNKVEKIAKQL